MISGQDWSDSNTWWGLALAILFLGFAIYAMLTRT
jgi:hypothetical protein